jgi:hypothetical protein
MIENALVPSENNLTHSETMSLAESMFKSGYFDVKSIHQALVKIWSGREFGVGAVASMNGIYIQNGKPALHANLMAAIIKKSGKYDYRIVKLDETECELVFTQNGQAVGNSKFTIEDAKKADLSGKEVYKKYTRNLLFARALSNGAKWYCPDAFAGQTPYVPEELGQDNCEQECQTIVELPDNKVEAIKKLVESVEKSSPKKKEEPKESKEEHKAEAVAADPAKVMAKHLKELALKAGYPVDSENSNVKVKTIAGLVHAVNEHKMKFMELDEKESYLLERYLVIQQGLKGKEKEDAKARAKVTITRVQASGEDWDTAWVNSTVVKPEPVAQSVAEAIQ